MSETKELNGRVARKSLAEQIDRLDGILDGLAEALNGAVADAVKDAVGHAVHEAVREAVAATLQAVLTDPGLKTVLATSAAIENNNASQAQAPVQGFAGRLGTAMKSASTRFATTARSWLSGLARVVEVVRRVRKPLSLAVAVGAVIGLGCFLAGPAVAAGISGLAGFAASLTASALNAIRRTLAVSPTPHA
jgi:hypothetical protein